MAVTPCLGMGAHETLPLPEGPPWVVTDIQNQLETPGSAGNFQQI